MIHFLCNLLQLFQKFFRVENKMADYCHWCCKYIYSYLLQIQVQLLVEGFFPRMAFQRLLSFRRNNDLMTHSLNSGEKMFFWQVILLFQSKEQLQYIYSNKKQFYFVMYNPETLKGGLFASVITQIRHLGDSFFDVEV